MTNARSLTFTLDLEDHTLGSNPACRYQTNGRAILEHLEKLGARATIFIVGDLVASCRALIQEAVASGHELALHSATHTPLTEESGAALRPKLVDAKSLLEDAAGEAVSGFRAPVFSLTADTVWVSDLLAELDFKYSSSVLPVANPLFGLPGAPRAPFAWPSGIIELPAPVVRLGPLSIPALGGIYLRYLPGLLQAAAVRAIAPEVLLWSYIHPYDIDDTEPYFRFPGTSAAMSLLLWRNRRATLRKIERLAASSGIETGAPLRERVEAMKPDQLQVFEPD
ncbi:MAG: DUF3473 domain-containing protein [Gammaproteobacteria bacterium]